MLRRLVPGRVLVSKTDPLQSVAEGLQATDVASEAKFVITTKDYVGKQCYNEGDEIVVKVETPSREELKLKITCQKDGEYNVTFTPHCVGQHHVVIEVNSQPLTSSP